ncbi:hypothetical protein BpHYR1_013660 [Brachionus plicatilis]|uniref:Uncharacterized protein n=1 Tax=Brachionus plicatilis TaxID=10195 RepID=A0A3M7SXJ3_BRAPC|nr:hypothetical protein BpHYR1_013660 [Brachionus plicatilis]
MYQICVSAYEAVKSHKEMQAYDNQNSLFFKISKKLNKSHYKSLHLRDLSLIYKNNKLMNFTDSEKISENRSKD